jgi:hypothetical protein
MQRQISTSSAFNNSRLATLSESSFLDHNLVMQQR